MRRIYSAAVLLLASLCSAKAAVIYVDAGAPGPIHDGASWATAYATIPAALTGAKSGDEAWVAAGSYLEAITLPPSVALYGGFAGTEATRAERDPSRNPTALRTVQGGAAISIPSGDARTIVDGFTLSCLHYGAGACGVSVGTASPVIRNCTIAGYWIGVYCNGTGQSTIERNVISGNGTGIHCYYAAPVIRNNQIRGNVSAQSPGGGIRFFAAGAPLVVGNVIAENVSGSSGGGIYAYSTSAMVRSNTFALNRAAQGGAATFSGGTVTFANNIVAFNDTGIQSDGASLTLRANALYGNSGYDFSGCPDPGQTYGHLRVDPKLAQPARGEYHIQPDSPCINAGSAAYGLTTETDFDGQPRIQNLRIDIGADESNGDSWPVVAPKTVRVAPGGSNANDGSDWGHPMRTVQAAIKAVSDSTGEVWAAAGQYAERITLPRGVSLYGGFAGTEERREQRDPRVHETVLDGGYAGTVVTVSPGATVGTLIDGLTVQRGACLVTPQSPAAAGSGLSSASAAFTVRGCTFVNNRSWGLGTLRLIQSWVMLEANRVTDNGSGVSFYQGGGRVTHNVIQRNLGVGLAIGSGVADNNVISGNSGGGVSLEWGSVTVINNAIIGNGAERHGGGIRSMFSGAKVRNNIIAFNVSGVSHEGDDPPEMANNCVFGNLMYDYHGMPNPTGRAGNISADPRIARVWLGNAHIQPDSPCVDAGAPDAAAGDTDMDGESRTFGARIDIGADESTGVSYPAPSYRTVRVRQGATGGDGSSWDRPLGSIQAGVDASAADGGAGEVWVQAGVYPESVKLAPDVAIYGGFAGGETDRDQRNPAAHVTVIEPPEDASAVQVTRGAGDTSVIDGFELHAGAGTEDGNGNSFHIGGGVFCYGSIPIVRNNVVTGRFGTYRSGIYGGGRIEGNTVTLFGDAAVTICYGALTGNRIVDNAALYGRGVNCRGASLVAYNEICGNGSDDGASGGGIYANFTEATIHGNVIHDNTASAGAGIYCVSGAPTITDNVLYGNYGGYGAGICAEYLTGSVTGNTLVGNECSDPRGGVMWLKADQSENFVAANNIVAFNVGGVSGSPVALTSNCVFGNEGFNFAPGIADPTGTAGNISADPAFVDRAARNLRLSPGSPCLDAGDDAVLAPGAADASGAPRRQGIHTDIGAYETPAPAYVLPDAIRAVKIAAGLLAASAADETRYDANRAASPGVDAGDAALALRRALGVAP